MSDVDAQPTVHRPDGSWRRVETQIRIRLEDARCLPATVTGVSQTGVRVELGNGSRTPVVGDCIGLVPLDGGAATRRGEVVRRDEDRRLLEIRLLEGPSDTHWVDIDEVRIDPAVAMRFPADRARRWRVLPFATTDDAVLVASADALCTRALPVLRRCYRRPVDVHVADAEALEAAIDRIYAAVATQAGEGKAPAVQAVVDDDATDTVALYHRLLASSVMLGASDLHLDSFDEEVRVRVRVDGRIEPLESIALEDGLSLINRIKVMAGLDIAERRAPQDGRLAYETASGLTVDVRVASLPTKQGERLTLRLLAQNVGHLTLASLGMDRRQLGTFEHAIRQPHGLVLLTGPTGSGKSTTLYAGIRQIMQESVVNIITIEDPVEYQIPGIAQVEVDQAEKVTFAKALRSSLRHDPDVIMVGEIRDAETADIAVKAALTGHLVLSTLHTNDAAGSITRLRNLGVPPYLTAATLRLVVAQRLVRRLCRRCAEAVECSEREATMLGLDDLAGKTVYAPRGCVYCGGRGYTGRLALFEMLAVDRELSELTAAEASDAELNAHLRRSGASTLAGDAATKLLEGKTSIEEALRTVVAFTPDGGDGD